MAGRSTHTNKSTGRASIIKHLTRYYRERRSIASRRPRSNPAPFSERSRGIQPHGGRMPTIRFVRFLLAISAFGLVASVARAQVPDPVADSQVPIPGVGHHYIGIGAETVNPADGSLSFYLPLQPPPGRGLYFPFGIDDTASS